MAGETTPCVLYAGTIGKRDGYGRLPTPVHGSRLAHRAALAEKLGRPVVGVARHTCDVPACVNPDHLIEGTQADNVHDMVDRDRQAKGPRALICIRGHDTTVVGRRPGNGQCLECRREDHRDRAARRKALRHERTAA